MWNTMRQLTNSNEMEKEGSASGRRGAEGARQETVRGRAGSGGGGQEC
jgi:hypothetical protein